jgi:hypothetical protein
VLVTTSYVSEQAYRELRDDRHPVIVMAGVVVVATLRNHQIATVTDAQALLRREFAATEKDNTNSE